jgi:tetratricopeptide (TPR) repeat protein
VASEREDTLKKAEKLLRQGRIDLAIGEYVRVVETNPRDWATANALGDLYVRVGQADQAAAQYARIAKHFAKDGFYPRAAALYKKILKIKPNDEEVHLELAEVSALQGLLADAKAHFTAVADRRRARGEDFAANQVLVRLGAIDPADFDARRRAAAIIEEQGDAAGAANLFRAMAAELEEKERTEEAFDALREVARLDPADAAIRTRLARAAIAGGRVDEARNYLTREVAGDDPALLEQLADVDLRCGRFEEGVGLLRDLLSRHPDQRSRVVQIGFGLVDVEPTSAFKVIDLAVDDLVAAAEWSEAAAILQEFVTRAPHQIPALLKLVEICVDGGLESAMYQAQAELADAYLTTGQATEAAVIAEDLVAREPWDATHMDRFRRALTMQGTPHPDAVIADRLSGQSPFTANDVFADPSAEPAGATEGVSEAAEPEPDSPAEEHATGSGGEAEPVAKTPQPEPAPEPAGDSAFRIAEGGIRLEGLLEDGVSATDSSSADRTARPGADAPSLDTVFKTIRKDAAKGGGVGKGAQHLALAETYAEMGMIDEAIASLEEAVRSPRHRFKAATALGRLYRERGEFPHAIEWMERAAQAPPPTPEEGYALLFDLGATLETLGETARALAVFLELQAEAGEYRDVASRVDRLARVQTGG